MRLSIRSDSCGVLCWNLPGWYGASVAEREGFEPSRELEPPTRLAGERLRPLGHLSIYPHNSRGASQVSQPGNSTAHPGSVRGQAGRHPVHSTWPYCLTPNFGLTQALATNSLSVSNLYRRCAVVHGRQQPRVHMYADGGSGYDGGAG